jgi:hypothetical protein
MLHVVIKTLTCVTYGSYKNPAKLFKKYATENKVFYFTVKV